MIGQKRVIQTISNLIKENRFPKFILLTGSRGWGKKELTRKIAKIMDIDLVTFENKVDDLRECIKLAYEQTSPILYVLTGADTMSIAAKNSILKLIEEPPTNAFIIMLAENEETILPTIKSRAYLLRLDSYSEKELRDYINTKDTIFTEDELDKVIIICDCPGDINLLMQPENRELLNLVDKIIRNIDEVTLSNLLKISKKFKINDSSEGIDIKLFLNCMQYVLYNKFGEEYQYRTKCYLSYIEIINCNKLLRAISVNKQYVIDTLVMRLWEIWNCGN